MKSLVDGLTFQNTVYQSRVNTVQQTEIITR